MFVGRSTEPNVSSAGRKYAILMREYRRCVIPSKITTTSPCLNANVRVLMQILDNFVFVELDSETWYAIFIFRQLFSGTPTSILAFVRELADEPGVVVQ